MFKVGDKVQIGVGRAQGQIGEVVKVKDHDSYDIRLLLTSGIYARLHYASWELNSVSDQNSVSVSVPDENSVSFSVPGNNSVSFSVPAASNVSVRQVEGRVVITAEWE